MIVIRKQMIDKVTYRREYKDRYIPLIEYYRKKYHLKIEENCSLPSSFVASENEKNIAKVFIRKRPMFENEFSNRQFDSFMNARFIHYSDLNFLILNRSIFPFHWEVFNEETTTHDLSESSVKSILYNHFGTVFCFGQTGSGKTFTMSGMINLFSEDLFTQLPSSKRVTMTYVELIGESVYDLLNEHKEVEVRDGGEGEFVLCENVWVDIKDSTELQRNYHLAGSLRETHATRVNSNSSRSHYICRLSILDQDNSEFARLTFCDLAGSERNIDSFYHNSERLKESAAINSSLMALKDVMRALVLKKQGTNVRIPYRASKLTRILKDGFETLEKPTQTILISTISPQACDAEHTMNTLKHVCAIGNHSYHAENGKLIFREVISEPKLAHYKIEDQLKPLTKMDRSETLEWLSKVRGGILKSDLKKFPSNMDGKMLTKQAEKRLQQLLESEILGSQLRQEIIDYTNKCNQQKVEHIETIKRINK
ncbi:kinesin [Naegleria gruberi]|uniref:Kinesin-like protein n=1 Tax=Naegleria gruberi TaxID=5762 RepID=D2V2Z2_NAEGR|nr:kinesin [Naegleria gruberi]EFC48536.1 kinesin [Naegleria gruberi]|eukprot:XP_002681280.1 kinesin [Naegleria gruberi]